MKLFHYTGTHHIDGIRQKGIRSGGLVVPTTAGNRIVRGWQWLTDDPSWQQGWATMETLDCDRTEVRFIVAIPKSHRNKLHRWDALSEMFAKWWVDDFREQGGGDSSHWYVFQGPIPFGWTRGMEQRPVRVAS